MQVQKYSLYQKPHIIRFDKEEPKIDIMISYHSKDQDIRLNIKFNEYKFHHLFFDKFEDTEIYLQTQDDIKINLEKDCMIVTVVVYEPSDKENQHFKITDLTPAHRFRLIRMLPKNFYDILAPENLYLVAGPKPVFANIDFHIRVPHKLVLSLVKVPMAGGPEVHKHLIGTEIFVVIKGKFQVEVDDEKIIAHIGDIIAIRTGVTRQFTNLSVDDSVILPIVLGVDDETEDIIFPAHIEDKMKHDASLYGKGLLWFAKRFGGLKFEAS